MFEDILWRFMHRWQTVSAARTLQTFIPVLLGLDMAHNIYYVAREYRSTQKGWKEARMKETSLAVQQVLRLSAVECALKHPEIWPQRLSTIMGLPIAAEQSADARIPEQARQDSLAAVSWDSPLDICLRDPDQAPSATASSPLPDDRIRTTEPVKAIKEVNGDGKRANASATEVEEAGDIEGFTWNGLASNAIRGALIAVCPILRLLPYLDSQSEDSDAKDTETAELGPSSSQHTESLVQSEWTYSTVQGDATSEGNNDLSTRAGHLDSSQDTPARLHHQHTAVSRLEAGPMSSIGSEPRQNDGDIVFWGSRTPPSEQRTEAGPKFGSSFIKAEAFNRHVEEAMSDLQDFCRTRWPMPVLTIQRRSAMRFRMVFHGFSEPIVLAQDCCRDLSHL